MSFFPDVIVTLILSLVHLLLSFNLSLPDQYQKKFRMYSIVANILFITFIGAFYLFISGASLSDQGVSMYFNSLATFYFLLFIPLAIGLSLSVRRLIMKADIYSVILKYALIIGLVTGIVGMVSAGYSLFIFFFYGFAP